MAKKKILLFIDSLAGGGAQRQIVALANNLDKSKYQVILLVYHPLWHYRELVDETNVRIVLIRKSSKLDLGYLWRLIRFIRSNRPDIILSYLNTPNMWARVAGRLSGTANIITSERNVDIIHSKSRVILEKLLHRYSTRIVVNAQSIKDIMTGRVGVDSTKIHVIYNGIDYSSFQKKGGDDAGVEQIVWDRGNFNIVLPGRLTEQKNHLCMLDALSLMRDRGRKIKLYVVGEVVDEQYLRLLKLKINKNHIEEHVEFLGQRRDMLYIYSTCDVVVLPSLWEGFPNVLLEAMAFGKVVIASDICDNSSLVIEGETGFLFESDNFEHLAEKLEAVIDLDSQDKQILGHNARKLVKESYSIDRMVSSYEKLFSELVSK